MISVVGLALLGGHEQKLSRGSFCQKRAPQRPNLAAFSSVLMNSSEWVVISRMVDKKWTAKPVVWLVRFWEFGCWCSCCWILDSKIQQTCVGKEPKTSALTRQRCLLGLQMPWRRCRSVNCPGSKLHVYLTVKTLKIAPNAALGDPTCPSPLILASTHCQHPTWDPNH